MPQVRGEYQNRSLCTEVRIGFELIKFKVTALILIRSAELNGDGELPVQARLTIPLNVMVPAVVPTLLSGGRTTSPPTSPCRQHGEE